MNLQDKKFSYISILPMLILIAATIGYPIVRLVYLSFTNTSNFNLINGTEQFVGLDNYIRHFNDKNFMISMWNTIYFTALSVGLSTIFGIILAYVVFPMNRRKKNIIMTCILLPSLISETACALIFRPMLDYSTGVFGYLLTLMGMNKINFLGSPAIAKLVIILLNVWQWTPYMFVFVLSGIEGLSDSYFDTLYLEGATAWQSMKYVILPLTKPIICVAVFFRVTNALRSFDKIYVLTGGGPGTSTDTISSYIQRVGIQRMEFGYSSSGGMIMLIFTAVIGLLALKLMYDNN